MLQAGGRPLIGCPRTSGWDETAYRGNQRPSGSLVDPTHVRVRDDDPVTDPGLSALLAERLLTYCWNDAGRLVAYVLERAALAFLRTCAGAVQRFGNRQSRRSPTNVPAYASGGSTLGATWW